MSSMADPKRIDLLARCFDVVREKVKVLICLGLDNTKLKTAFRDHVDTIVRPLPHLPGVERTGQRTAADDAEDALAMTSTVRAILRAGGVALSP